MASGDTNQTLVRQFHKAFSIPNIPDPDNPDMETSILRRDLLEEEYAEVWRELEAIGLPPGLKWPNGDPVVYDRAQLAKELADLLYIAYGTAEVFGIDLDWAFREVHASNMTKLDSNGKPIYREDGKVLKGPNYRPPNMKLVVYGNDSEFLQAN